MSQSSGEFSQVRRNLLEGRIDRHCARGTLSSEAPAVLFPGAFNPLHDGHWEITRLSAHLLNAPVHFEISITNVDKADLDQFEIESRLSQFNETDRVWLTRAPTFVEKARLFPGVTFLVGADTIQRIGDPKYYGGSEQSMVAAITRIAEQDCRFLVFGRTLPAEFMVLSQLELPPELSQLCNEVTQQQFRNDISSSAIRKRK